MVSEPLKEQHGCYLKGYDIQKEKKYRQGTVTALVFAPKAGNSLANLKIKYASIKQLSLLDSRSGGRNSIAYIMQTYQVFFFFQKFKEIFSPIFLIPQKDSKIQNRFCSKQFNHLCSSDLLLLSSFFFSLADITQQAFQGKGELLVHHFLIPPEPTFCREDFKWVTSLVWPLYKCHTHACPLSYFQNSMANPILRGLAYLPLRSWLVFKSHFLPQRLTFSPTSTLPPFSFALSFVNGAVL